MTEETKQLTDQEITQREASINMMIVAQKKRITNGSAKAVDGTITLIVLETLRKALKDDVTVILPTPEFAEKFIKSLAIVMGILKVPQRKIDSQVLWVWDRSRLALTNREYYRANKSKFWGTFVNEIRL